MCRVALKEGFLMRRTLISAVLLAGLLGPAAAAQTVVLGTSKARSCYESALTGNPGTRSAMETCRQALVDPVISVRDKAATYANLGILLVRSGDIDSALSHYDQAISLRGDLGQAYINRATLRMEHLGDAQLAEADYTRAIELGGPDMHIAHFGRGLAREQLGDLPGAYADLTTALELRPGWAPVEAELARYSVAETNGASS
jgi:tetratricopeptide (TPR) repeat protein